MPEKTPEVLPIILKISASSLTSKFFSELIVTCKYLWYNNMVGTGFHPKIRQYLKPLSFAERKQQNNLALKCCPLTAL